MDHSWEIRNVLSTPVHFDQHPRKRLDLEHQRASVDTLLECLTCGLWAYALGDALPHFADRQFDDCDLQLVRSVLDD